MMPLSTQPRATPGAQSGASIITAIFMLLLFAGLAAFMASMVTSANIASAQDVQGVRAYQAARAGVEWGLYQVLDPLNTTAHPAMPACPAGTPPVIDGFVVTLECDRKVYTEADQSIAIYALLATASTGGSPGPSSFIERQIAVTVSKCRSPSSSDCL